MPTIDPNSRVTPTPIIEYFQSLIEKNIPIDQVTAEVRSSFRYKRVLATKHNKSLCSSW